MTVKEKIKEKLVELIGSTPCVGFSSRSAVEHVANWLVQNDVTVQEWIAASEPPKDTYEYWIAYKTGGDYFYSTGYFDGKCWRSAITHKQIPVTHWTYLPQPPKGE